MSKRVLRLVGLLVWSVAVWVALWSDLTIANVFWGLVLGGLTLLLVPLGGTGGRATVRPLAVLHLAAYFTWALIRASAVVAWEIVTPPIRINQGVVTAPLRTRSPGLVTLIANMISLTPGALTLEVRQGPPTLLLVHVLHLRSFDEVRDDIRELEDLTLRAFPIDIPDDEESR